MAINFNKLASDSIVVCCTTKEDWNALLEEFSKSSYLLIDLKARKIERTLKDMKHWYSSYPHDIGLFIKNGTYGNIGYFKNYKDVYKCIPYSEIINHSIPQHLFDINHLRDF